MRRALSGTVESTPMKTCPSSLRLTSWLTIVALLTMLWSGTVSAVATEATSLTPWGEICSVNAQRSDGGTTGSGHSKDGVHVHCAFCCKHSAAHFLPVRFDVAPATAAATSLPQVNRNDLAIVSEAWLQRPSRGPPTIR